LDDLKEIDERLSTFIKDAGAPPFEGTDFVMKYEDEKAAEAAGTEGPESKEDPFNAFGFGILEYFKLLQALIYIYIVICIMLVPVWLKYYKGGALAGLRGSTPLTELTLGNLGFATYKCANSFLQFDRASELSCDQGVMSPITYAGIYPHVTGVDGDDSTAKYISNKGKDVFQDFCGAPTDLWRRPAAGGTNYNCTEYLHS
jgi:hypothetical protein